MNATENIKKNLSYQTIYQLLITILPLITAPYLARTLGVSMQGVYSYANSIVNYFTLFAMLGIVNHGTRSIAQVKNDLYNRSKNFFTIFIIQIISCVISLILYSLYILFLCNEYKDIALIQALAIISCFFDINWLFFGMEDFKFVVIRNIIIKIITVTLILTLVKQPSDLWIYALLMTGSTLLSNLILLTKFQKYIIFVMPTKKEVLAVIKPILILFIPLLAMSFYHIMDKTMLGILSTYNDVGYYYNADKVINIPIGIITGISTVLFPRSVIYLNDTSTENFKSLLFKSIEGTIALSIGLAFGISAISNEFVPLFFGKGFEYCILLIITLAPVMIFKSISTIIRFQYLVPLKKEKYFIYSVLIGAIVNFISNIILIPIHGALGAVLGTLIAEIVACIVQILYIRKEMNIIFCIIKSIPYLVFGIIMFIIVKILCKCLFMSLFFKVIFEAIFGGVIFIGLVIFYWIITKNELLNLFFQNSFFNKLNLNKKGKI